MAGVTNALRLHRLLALDLHKLRKHLTYDETSPSGLRWVVPTCVWQRPGAVAGRLSALGYYVVKFDYLAYPAHHLVLLLHDRYPAPGQECDHIDRNRGNNHISNLRWVTKSQNIRNKAFSPSSGHRFVSLNKGSNRNPFIARYYDTIRRKDVYVGCFSDPYEAHLAAVTHRLEHCWNP